MKKVLHWICYLLAIFSGGLTILALLDGTELSVWGSFAFITSMLVWCAYLLRTKQPCTKLSNLKEKGKKQQKSKNRMDADTYKEFLQMAQTSLQNSTFEYNDAVLLRDFLRSKNGYKDSRTRKIANLFKEFLAKNSLSQANSIRLVQALHHFLGTKAPKLTPEQEAILKQQQEDIKLLEKRKKTKKTNQSTKKWEDDRRRDFYEIINEDDVEIGNRYQIVYVDYHGNKTERVFTLHNVSHNNRGDLLLEGWDELRNDSRTFKVRNIEEMVDLETGEMII